jgi:copper chaperone CopZ
MKTSVIEVHDMLSVLSVDEVETRIGEAPGVKSVTVNYAAGNATVRYDETRLDIADLKSTVRQRGFETPAPAAAASDLHKGHTVPGSVPAIPAAAAQNSSPGAPSTASPAKLETAAPPTTSDSAPTESVAAPGPVSAAPKTVPGAESAGAERSDKAVPEKSQV